MECHRLIGEGKKMGKRMEDLDLQGAVGRLTADWRGEVIAACLGEQGYDPARVLFKRVGSGRRGYAREVEGMRLVYTDTPSYGTYLEVDVNRASMYDSMPEGLFHSPLHQGRDKGKEQVVEEIRRHSSEEYFVRRFMRLFETEADHNLTEIQLLELRFDKRDKYGDFAKVFEPYWDMIGGLTLRQANLLLAHIPRFHHIREDAQEMGRTLSAILEVPVNVREAYGCRETAAGKDAGLRAKRLGVDATLGGGTPDGLPDFVITLGDMPADAVGPFLRGAKTRRVLERLCEMLLPANALVSFRLTVVPGERQARLSPAGYPCRLGINSRLAP
jgi:hypothetical protein